MKRLSFAFTIAVAIFSFSLLHAQKTTFEVKYDIDLSGADIDPMAKMMMKNATMDMAFQNEAARVVMNMGLGGTTTVIADDASKEGVILLNMMGMKYAMLMEEGDFEDAKENSGKMDFRKTGETKEIAGYACQHAIGKDDQGNEFDFWYTNLLKPKNMGTGYNFDGINGFPLEMEMMQDGMRMKMKAKSVSTDALSADLFDPAVPKGYKVRTKEEMMKMGGR
ncbi:MAG: DUF4412 domain-containing protein [Bacteroidota bacterium]